MEHMMQSRDLLLRLCSKIDNGSLKLLSHTSLWRIIKQFSEDEHFWSLRIQHLLGIELKTRSNVGWKIAYYSLLGVDKIGPFGNNRIFSDKLSVEILLESGYDPSSNNNIAIVSSCANGYTETVRLLLQDERVDPCCHLNSPIRSAAQNGHTEVVRLLLKDKRINNSTVRLSGMGDVFIQLVASSGHVDVMKLLLSEEGVTHSINQSVAIGMATLRGHTEIVELLKSIKK